MEDTLQLQQVDRKLAHTLAYIVHSKALLPADL